MPLVSVTAIIAEDWRQFRGPTGQGHSTSTGLPVVWDQETNVAWKVNLPGHGWSSPILLDGRVYLTTAVPGDDADQTISLRAICLDAQSGRVHWDVEVGTVASDTAIHPKNSHASATPVATQDRIFVHFASHGTAALTLEGEIIWKKTIDYLPHHGTGSSPVVFEDQLIFNCDGLETPFVLSLDTSTGVERWRTPRPDIAKMKFSFSTPLIIDVEGHPQLISPASGMVCSYNPYTGEQLWMVGYPNRWSVIPRPVHAAGLILVSTGYEGPSELLAIRDNAAGDATESHVAWRANRFVPHSPSPIIHNETVYLVSDKGIASCRDLRTGKLIWKERIGGNYSASPLQAEDRIYLLSETGQCTVIRASRTFEVIAKNDLAEPSLASMVPAGNSLLIRTAESLYRIEEAGLRN